MAILRTRANCEIDTVDAATCATRYAGLVNERIWAAGGGEVDDARFVELYADVVAACIREANGDRSTLVRLLVDAADRELL